MTTACYVIGHLIIQYHLNKSIYYRWDGKVRIYDFGRKRRCWRVITGVMKGWLQKGSQMRYFINFNFTRLNVKFRRTENIFCLWTGWSTDWMLNSRRFLNLRPDSFVWDSLVWDRSNEPDRQFEIDGKECAYSNKS